jgi:hypothetical protein
MRRRHSKNVTREAPIDKRPLATGKILIGFQVRASSQAQTLQLFLAGVRMAPRTCHLVSASLSLCGLSED